MHLARLLWPRSLIIFDHMVELADTVRSRRLGRGVTRWLLDRVDRATLAPDVVVVDADVQLSPSGLAQPRAVLPPRATSAAGTGRRARRRRHRSGSVSSAWSRAGGTEVIGRALATVFDTTSTSSSRWSGRAKTARRLAALPGRQRRG